MNIETLDEGMPMLVKDSALMIDAEVGPGDYGPTPMAKVLN